MTSRGNESPMEFEWEGHGPVDPSSPFHKLAMENQRKIFESPPKSAFPHLREPNGQPWFFSNVPKAPDSPYRAPSFTTPRKPSDFDFSSGPESSPMGKDDNDDTPDGKPLPALPAEADMKKSKRNSLFGFYGRFAPSPGRGEIKKPSTAIARRVQRRRRNAQKFDRQRALDLASGDDTSGDEARPSSSESNGSRTVPQEVGWITSFFAFIHAYPDAPSIIAKYLQVFFNAAILFGCLFMFWSFYATIRADVDRAGEEAMSEILSEMKKCSDDYIQNGCATDQRRPALEPLCRGWELCMNRDPNAVKRASLSAHTFAEIFNSFIEPISLKTMIFTTTFVALGLLINNVTFSMYRQSQQSHVGDGYRQHSGTWMPPTQSTHMSHFPSTPATHYAQNRVAWHEQSPSKNQRYLEHQSSPSKDRSRSRSPEKKILKM